MYNVTAPLEDSKTISSVHIFLHILKQLNGATKNIFTRSNRLSSWAAVLWIVVPSTDIIPGLGWYKLRTEATGVLEQLLVVGTGGGANILTERESIWTARGGSLRTSLAGIGRIPWNIFKELGVWLSLDWASTVRVKELLVCGSDFRVRRTALTNNLARVDDAASHARFVRLNDSLDDAERFPIKILAVPEAVISRGRCGNICYALVASLDAGLKLECRLAGHGVQVSHFVESLVTLVLTVLNLVHNGVSSSRLSCYSILAMLYSLPVPRFPKAAPKTGWSSASTWIYQR